MNCRSITPAKVSLTIMIVGLIICAFAMYKLFLEREIRCNILVNEIVQMKVTSCEIDTISWMNTIKYEYMIENKYRISVDYEPKIPYKNESRYEVYIKNVDGEVLFLYCTRWNSLNYAWKSDFEKLMKYLKL